MNLVKNHKYGLIPHWINTSSNALVKKLITEGGLRFKSDVEKLIKGESVEKVIKQNIIKIAVAFKGKEVFMSWK